MYYQKAKIQNPIDKYGFHEFTNYPCRKDWRHCLIKQNNSIYYNFNDPKISKENVYLKKISNKMFRHMKHDDVSNNGWYKKVFDLTWELF